MNLVLCGSKLKMIENNAVACTARVSLLKTINGPFITTCTPSKRIQSMNQ